MAFADLGQCGTAGNTTANQASLACTLTTAGAAVGNLVLVAVTVDNRASGGGDDASVASVTDDASPPNIYFKARQEATNLAAQAGSSVSLWWTQVRTALTTSSVVTATFTTNTTSDAQAMCVRKFSVASGNFVMLAGTAGTTSTTTNPGSLNVTTPSNEYLRVRAIGCEFDTTQTLTQTTNWQPWTEAGSAASGTTAEQCLEVEHRIITATGEASAPTLGSASDNASVYAAFIEVRPAPETVYETAPKVLRPKRAAAIAAIASAVAFTPQVPSAPAAAATTVSGLGNDSALVRQSKLLYDPYAGPVAPPARPSIVGALPSDQPARVKRRLTRLEGAFPLRPADTPAAPGIDTTLTSAPESATVRHSRLLYDPYAGPVKPPDVAQGVGVGTFILGQSDVVTRKIRRQTPRSAFVFAIPDDILPPASNDQPVKFKKYKRPQSEIIQPPQNEGGAAPPPGIATTLTASFESATVIRSRVLYDPYAGPVLPPSPAPPGVATATAFPATYSSLIVRHTVVFPEDIVAPPPVLTEEAQPPEDEFTPHEPPTTSGGAGGGHRPIKLYRKKKLKEELEELLEALAKAPAPTPEMVARAEQLTSQLSLMDGIPPPEPIVILPHDIGDDDDEEAIMLLLEIL